MSVLSDSAADGIRWQACAAEALTAGTDDQARKVIAPDRFFLVKQAPATVGKMLQSLEPRARRRVESRFGVMPLVAL